MESSLADTYWDVIGSVGIKAGWGRGPHFDDPEWSPRKETTLKSVVKSGLRQFYRAHEWSFLFPRTRMTLPSGEKTLKMPFDFDGANVSINLVSSSGGTNGAIRVTDQVRQMYAVYPDATGVPRCVEIEPLKDTTRERGQRWQLVVYPEPTSDYTLEVFYKVSGQMLSGDLPYAYGGSEHSETILASCLAIWEHRIDDIPPNSPQAVAYPYYREQLAISIRNDRLKQPQTLGYNGDRSDGHDRRSNRYPRDYSWPSLRINGVLYD